MRQYLHLPALHPLNLSYAFCGAIVKIASHAWRQACWVLLCGGVMAAAHHYLSRGGPRELWIVFAWSAIACFFMVIAWWVVPITAICIAYAAMYIRLLALIVTGVLAASGMTIGIGLALVTDHTSYIVYAAVAAVVIWVVYIGLRKIWNRPPDLLEVVQSAMNGE